MTEKKIHPDQSYIDALLTNNSFVIQRIYEEFVPKIVRFICANSGDESQAKDIVQDVLTIIYKQARDKDLQLTCPFEAYFFLLCKRKWYNTLKKTERKQVTIDEEKVSPNDASEVLVFETDVYQQKEQLFSRMFGQLGQKCQDLLKTAFALKSMEKVAEKLEISYGYARKKKSLCIGRLTELIQSSDEFKHLKNQ